MKDLPSKVIFIGAGPSALFAARRLEQIAAAQNKTVECIFLERENEVGGKCHTFSDPKNKKLKTEWGAGAVAPNYGVVLDALEEHGIAFENMLPMEKDTVEIHAKFDHLSLLEKMSFTKQLVREIRAFNHDYDVYKKAKQRKTDIPQELNLPFEEYSALRKMEHFPILAKPFVPGFGYGALSHCPTYAVLEYLGKVTIPDVVIADTLLKQPSLLAIHGGFQLLMEEMAKNRDVRLGVKVGRIERTSDQVKVHYQSNGIEHIETADTLVLAMSPKNWSSLGMDLTSTEQECIDELEFYRYPVAVYKIKGLPPKQYYFPKALEASGFGHLALITSRDNREDPADGRLCTVYVNLPPNQNNFVFDHELLASELKSIEGVTDVEVIGEKIWEDYMSTLPWDLRLRLDKEQEAGNTMYLGSYVLGGFEDVCSVANKATDAMTEAYTQEHEYVEDFSMKNMKRAWQFFTGPVYPPLTSLTAPEKAQSRCDIF